MAYRKPPFFVRRVFNPLAMRFEIGGSKQLAVRGRRTGRIQRVPVIPLEHEGARYLVTPRGETDWVKNIRAAGEADLGRRSGVEHIRVSEVPAAERAPIIAAYQMLAGKAVTSHFEALPDPADHPVFRIL
jgi:deazaflavin-dependent oxidoreductase (nitroreductase family)